MKNTNEIISNILNKIKGKDLVIEQEGFVESKYKISNTKCKLEEDIFSIEDRNNYIRINVNQLYNIEIEPNRIVLFLDNDTKIILK